MEILEAHRLGAQAVEVRRLEDRVAVGRDVAIALVVGQEEDDVGALAFKGDRLAEGQREKQVESKEQNAFQGGEKKGAGVKPAPTERRPPGRAGGINSAGGR
jgi:hypothetical protein